MNSTDYKIKLKERGLKVTPQRLAVLEAVDVLHDHPTAEEVGSFIRLTYPNIATGTVYKTLETLVDKDIIIRVKTDRGILRYDAVREVHHHLYCAQTDRIEDYYDDDLTRIINRYFKKKVIPNFRIEDIKLQIMGRFTGKNKRDKVMNDQARQNTVNNFVGALKGVKGSKKKEIIMRQLGHFHKADKELAVLVAKGLSVKYPVK